MVLPAILKQGPVAQRLEQGTHNPKSPNCLKLAWVIVGGQLPHFQSVTSMVLWSGVITESPKFTSRVTNWVTILKKGITVSSVEDDLDESDVWEVPNWIERIVAIMVREESPDSLNHEAWVGIIRQPIWVDRIEELYFHSWRGFPASEKELEPAALGRRIGREIGARLFGLESIKDCPEKVLEQFAQAMEIMEPGASEKVKEEFAAEGLQIGVARLSEAREETLDLADQILKIVFRQKVSEIAGFMSGFSKGLEHWAKDDPYSDQEVERVTVARILWEYWAEVEQLGNLRQVADFALERMPKGRSSFLMKNIDARNAFDDQVRKLCRKVGLSLANRGRPKKGDSASRPELRSQSGSEVS